MISSLPFPEDAAPQKTPLLEKIKRALREYLTRLKGEGVEPPPWITLSWDALASVILSCITLLVLAFIQHWAFAVRDIKLYSVIPAFGATTAIVFGATQVHAAQPRAVLVGFLIGGTLGVTADVLFRSATGGDESERELMSIQIGVALAVSLTLALMKITSTIHPPSCAAATFAAAFTTPRGSNGFDDKGYMFLATPILLGATVLILCAWLGNNLVPRRKHYPAVW